VGKGLRTALRDLSFELRLQRLHRRGVRHAQRFRVAKDLKLHIGCGSNIRPSYINIDINPKADLTLDIREPLPFESGSCALTYSEHFLEHLDYPDEALQFLRECYRVLQPGGKFSVGVPDAEWPIRAYVGDAYYADWFRYVKANVYPEWANSRMECVNYSFRQGREHKFGYDFDTLKRALELVGFVAVRRRDFDPTLDSETSRYSLDTDVNKCTTLYVDAFKPSR
jgi:predicted SAM-dependent methyltransferase